MKTKLESGSKYKRTIDVTNIYDKFNSGKFASEVSEYLVSFELNYHILSQRVEQLEKEIKELKNDNK